MPSDKVEIVTLVMDGGTAYVLTLILGMTIREVERRGIIPGASRDVLVHAHDQIAGQLGMDPFEEVDHGG